MVDPKSAEFKPERVLVKIHTTNFGVLGSWGLRVGFPDVALLA